MRRMIASRIRPVHDVLLASKARTTVEKELIGA
jgi:hypothetical protein